MTCPVQLASIGDATATRTQDRESGVNKSTTVHETPQHDSSTAAPLTVKFTQNDHMTSQVVFGLARLAYSNAVPASVCPLILWSAQTLQTTASTTIWATLPSKCL